MCQGIFEGTDEILTKWTSFICGKVVEKYSFISNHFEEHKADSNKLYNSTIEEIVLGVTKQVGV